MTNFVITGYKKYNQKLFRKIFNFFLVSRFKGENTCQNSITKNEVLNSFREC